jgi:hypothetical protein
MQQISQNVSSANINLQFHPLLYEGITKADKQMRQHLQKKLKEWKQPCLSNVWVMQLNLVSSISQVQAVKQEQYNELKHLGLDPDLLMMEDDEPFGQDEALAYKQLFESVPIDHMPVMTIGTKNLAKRVLEMASTKSLDERIQEMEDEILSVAIIQKLAKRKRSQLEGRSYVYRLGGESYGRETEYLYKPWFEEYQQLINAARESAQKHKEGAAIRTDIKSYYTTIVQEQLIEEIERELNIRSQRIKWLLRLLLSKKLDKHESGHGLTQGNVGSGFWANVYLISVDARFDSDNEWNVKFYRYLDDMILVVPSPEDVDDVLGALRNELKKLNLTLYEKKNEKKTEIYDTEEKVARFLEETKEDKELEQLSQDFEDVINPLWIMNSEYRAEFEAAYRNNDWWWCLIERYQQCLRSLNIYVTEPDLSRKISKYLFNSKRRKKDLKRKEELKLPPFPNNDTFTAIANWAICFEGSELKWIDEKNNFRTKLIKLFHNSWINLGLSEEEISPSRERKLQRHIRFAVNKLSLLGLAEIQEEVVEILCMKPFVAREPLHTLESLARQGYTTAIRRIIEHHRDSQHEMSEYMRAVTLQAMRFLPNINTQDWKIIVESATRVDSVVEKLKATETWLYLGDVAKRFVRPQHINDVVKALKSDPPPINRLKKNYILILGLHDKKASPELQTSSNDYLIRDALDIALEETTSDLFEEYEPLVIRQNYYSVKISNNTDEEEYK